MNILPIFFDVHVILKIARYKDICLCLSARNKHIWWHVIVIQVATQKFVAFVKKKTDKKKIPLPKKQKFKNFWENLGFTDNFQNSTIKFSHYYISLAFLRCLQCKKKLLDNIINTKDSINQLSVKFLWKSTKAPQKTVEKIFSRGSW